MSTSPHELISRIVEWSDLGHGRNVTHRGTAMCLIEPGQTPVDALRELVKRMPEIGSTHVMPNYSPGPSDELRMHAFESARVLWGPLTIIHAVEVSRLRIYRSTETFDEPDRRGDSKPG
jgi:hypothetical protein